MTPFIKLHRDGSLWANGQTVGDVPEGYWEWFRKDGAKLRSGTFRASVQIGEWTTYDAQGKPYKVTRMKDEGVAGD
jgi:antitoxin component YwqK of YwqJK toxin-antitoxin module